MVTKSKSKTTPTAAELSRMALDEARAHLAARQDQHQSAEAIAAELVTRLRNGDDTPTNADLLTAETDVRRFGMLVEGAEKAVKRAERALLNDDTAVADLFAGLLSEAFGEVPVQVTGIPAEAQPNSDGRSPVLWIVQEKPTTKSGGILSGVLDLVYFRPRRYAVLDAREVEAQSRARGFAVTSRQVSQATVGELLRDSLRITVDRAFHPVPELAAAPSREAVQDFARVVNADLAQAVMGTRPTGLRVGNGAPVRAGAELVEHRTSAAPGEDGTVSVTVETTSKVKPGSGIQAAFAHERLRHAVADQVERVAAGVGRVVTAEAVSIDMPDPTPQTAQRPWEVTARFVLAYRLA